MGTFRAIDWPVASPLLASLAEDEVHIWRVPLDVKPCGWEALRDVLSPDERARADRFHFEQDRHRFVACRYAQRHILAGYIGEHAMELRFCYGKRGKPFMDPAHGAGDVHFNVTNSKQLALCAVARSQQLGVDVEQIRETRDLMGIAEHFFAPSEILQLADLRPPDQRAAFFALWTRKEALIKAVGEGLAFPLDQVEVSSSIDEARVTRFGDDSAERWGLEVLFPQEGYIGAVATQRSRMVVRRYTFAI